MRPGVWTAVSYTHLDVYKRQEPQPQPEPETPAIVTDPSANPLTGLAKADDWPEGCLLYTSRRNEASGY